MTEQRIRNMGTITINGIEYPYQVDSTRQAKRFCELAGLELEYYETEVAAAAKGGKLAEHIGQLMLYSMLYAGAERKRVKLDLTLDDVINLTDDSKYDKELEKELMKPLNLLNEITAEKVALIEEQLKKAEGQ